MRAREVLRFMITLNQTVPCLQTFDNDPFAPPPATINEIGNINTGRAYTETYKKLITKPGKQVLFPVIFYIDGAATGHFVDLKITAVKFTFGILSLEIREVVRL